MGILNVTPDSFSDGGLFFGREAAVQHAQLLLAQGADIIDVGGESTRPGAARVDPDSESRRVLPVIEALADSGAVVSIDTMNAATARAAVAAGAAIVNDVSGGLADARMFPTVAELAVPYVLMHWRGHSAGMAAMTQYRDVAAEVGEHLARQHARALAAGMQADRIVVDPGLGFAKEHHHNWQLLADFDRWSPPGRPVLIGASRKRFLGALLTGSDGAPRPVGARDDASAAISALAAAAGAWCVRVHDVAASADAVRVVAAWRAADSEGVLQ